MKMFEWSFATRVVFGPGRFETASKWLRGFGKSALVVTSRSFMGGGARASVLDGLLAQLRKLGVDAAVFGEIEPNPRTTTLERATALAREVSPRYVIGLGGGSVLDAAKCVALLARNPGDILEYAYRGPGRPMRPFNSALPIVCIPTIAAAGSEANMHAVVTHWENHRKIPVFGEALLPKLAIIDPELTYSVGPRQTIHGAFDMLTHLLETYLSAPGEYAVQDALTEALSRAVVEALPRALESPRDQKARSTLSWCATLALSGALSGREGGWPIHALEHGLSAWTDASHGHGLAMLLPRVMEFDLRAAGEKIARWNRQLFGVKTSDPGRALEEGLNHYMRTVGAWTTLSEFATPTLSVDTLVSKVTEHALDTSAILRREENPYLENIVRLYEQDCREILSRCRA